MGWGAASGGWGVGGGGQRSAAKDTIKVSCIASAISLGLELNMNGLVSRQKGVWGGWVGCVFLNIATTQAAKQGEYIVQATWAVMRGGVDK